MPSDAVEKGRKARTSALLHFIDSDRQQLPGIEKRRIKKIMGNGCFRSSVSSSSPAGTTTALREKRVDRAAGACEEKNDCSCSESKNQRHAIGEAVAASSSITYRKGVCALEYWEPIVLLGEGSISSIHLVRRRPERVEIPYRESADVMANSCSAKSPCSFRECAKGNAVYALKSIHKDHVRNDKYLEEMRKEIYTMSHLDHPNIVKVLEAYERKRHIYMVMEYCQGGDLSEAEGTSESHAQSIVRSILLALQYLHERKVVHRDRKWYCCWAQPILLH